MDEFEEIKKFIQNECKCNVIDITSNMILRSYPYYCDIAIKNPNNVYVSKRALHNDDLFTLLASFTTDETEKVKYLLIKNDNYHTTFRFSKAYISKFVLGGDKEIYECGICLTHSLSNNICGNCTFNTCGYCVKKLILSNNLRCPQCRKEIEIYDNNIFTDWRRKFDQEYKLNIDDD